MKLPGSFIADLPPEATLTPTLVTDACLALRRNREQQMVRRSTESIAGVVAEISANWLQPDYPFRQMALKEGPANAGFSSQTLIRGIDAFFEAITIEQLQNLLFQEFGHARRLDGIVATPDEQKAQIAAMATGPELLVHIGAGNVPSSLWMSMVTGLLLRSAQFIKCASGSSFLPRLFAHSLYDVDPTLASCIEIAEWRGGREDLEGALMEQADCLTVTGSDETLAHIRARVPARVRFVGYGHRVSFGFVARQVLTTTGVKKIVSAAGDDIVAWNQLGCLSPHVIYVETGGSIGPEQFAETLAAELARRETVEPRGELDTAEAAIIASRRGFYEVRASSSSETRLWCSPGSTAWTVVFETDPRFQVSCLNRFIFVKPARDAREMLESADSFRTRISTIGMAAPELRSQELAQEFGRWGASRVCPLGRMQKPPLSWRHDGRSPLGELVHWTNWERD
jgi:hypothetical protein